MTFCDILHKMKLFCSFVLQIIIAFRQQFWPARLYDVICTHSFVPEFWMTQHEAVDQHNKALHAVVGEQLVVACMLTIRH